MLFSNWRKKSIILQVWPKKHCYKLGKGDHKREDDEQQHKLDKEEWKEKYEKWEEDHEHVE
jgi:hypothetical protein